MLIQTNSVIALITITINISELMSPGISCVFTPAVVDGILLLYLLCLECSSDSYAR